MIGYIFTKNKNKNIKDNIKCEIGKRYRFTKTLINYNISPCRFKSDCDLDDFYSDDKIYKIKIYDNNIGHTTKDFKILQEINYKDLLNSENREERIISAIKNKEESVLNDFIKSNSYDAIRTIIKSNVHKYLDEITTIAIKNKGIIPYIAYLIRDIGRNKDLDYFINCDNNKVKCEIADIGRPQDLDILIDSGNFYALHSVLENGRSKDINKDIEDMEYGLYDAAIIKTGIDKYLDKLINNENEYFLSFLNLAEQGRKCDLDIFVYDEDEEIREAVARHGYDDHLDILAKENNPNINKIINELRGKRE